jgi:hypothetical protein
VGGRHDQHNWRQKGYILAFLSAALDHHIAQGHYDATTVNSLKGSGISFFSSAAIAARQSLPEIVVNPRQRELPFLRLTGGSQELLSQQENRVAAEQRHGETAAQLKAILEAITQAPQKGADLVDANMVCPRLLQRF